MNAPQTPSHLPPMTAADLSVYQEALAAITNAQHAFYRLGVSLGAAARWRGINRDEYPAITSPFSSHARFRAGWLRGWHDANEADKAPKP